jgi:hypothetical protein
MYFINTERLPSVLLSVWIYCCSKHYVNLCMYQVGLKLIVKWTFRWGNIALSMFMHVVRAKFCFIIVHICCKIWNNNLYHKYVVIRRAQKSCRGSSSRWCTQRSIKIYHISMCVCDNLLFTRSFVSRKVLFSTRTCLPIVLETLALSFWSICF